MFHSRTLNSKINKLQERALRIVFNDITSSFDQLLEKDNSVRIHIRNLQYLAIEMYKINIKYPQKLCKKYFLSEVQITTLETKVILHFISHKHQTMV